MTDRQTLIDLRDRVRAATGPDREIDRAVFDAIGIEVKEFDPGDGDIYQWRVWKDGQKVENTHITASLDAIRALTMRLLPDLYAFDIDMINGEVFIAGTDVSQTVQRPDKNVELACIEALLMALIRIEEKADE